PGGVAKRVLNRWRELIERERPGLLGTEELAGLFGELWVLAQLANESPSAIEGWTGPLGARFDFQRATTALEVKTSLSRNSTVVHIHGLDQLDPAPDQALYLTVLSIESQAAGLSVPSLVRQIQERGVDALALATRLRAAGYVTENSGYYEDLAFLVRA